MRKRVVLLASCLALVLAGCQAEAASMPSDTPAPMEVSAPPEKPEPSAALSPLEELLAAQPIDDTHDAFLVDTGGRLGTLLVTVEKGEQDPELWEFPLCFAVWNPEDMSRPIQKLEGTTRNVFHWHAELDANFDGYMDFSYIYAMGNQPNYWYLWIWDEEAAQFVEVPEYKEISSPRCNPETGIIDGWARNSGAGDGTTTFHRWEDGELVCVRRIRTWWEGDEGIRTEDEITVFPVHITVEDRIDGELVEIYSRVLAPDENFHYEQLTWSNLDKHGE